MITGNFLAITIRSAKVIPHDTNKSSRHLPLTKQKQKFIELVNKYIPHKNRLHSNMVHHIFILQLHIKKLTISYI